VRPSGVPASSDAKLQARISRHRRAALTTANQDEVAQLAQRIRELMAAPAELAQRAPKPMAARVVAAWRHSRSSGRAQAHSWSMRREYTVDNGLTRFQGQAQDHRTRDRSLFSPSFVRIRCSKGTTPWSRPMEYSVHHGHTDFSRGALFPSTISTHRRLMHPSAHMLGR